MSDLQISDSDTDNDERRYVWGPLPAHVVRLPNALPPATVVQDAVPFAHLRGFHDDRAKNVTFSVHKLLYKYKKTAPPPPRRPCYSTDRKHFQTQLSYQRNKFSDQISRKLGHNVTSRVFTCFHYIHIEKNTPPTGSHVFSPIWTIFELCLQEKLHPPSSHVIQLTGTIFELNSHIKETNVLIKFHENWAKIHVFSPIWTIFELPNKKNCTPPPSSHVIQLTGTIFELNSHIKETNVLTKFHENWAKNVTSKVEKCPAHWRPCFSPIWTIFELVRDINKTNVFTNFHDDWAKIVTSRVFTRKTAPPPGSHVIELTGTIFELNSNIKETNVLTKFCENWAKNVTSRVFTCFHYIHIEKNAPPTGCHVFSPIWTIFELKNAPPTGSHVFSPIWTIFELVRDINKTNVLTNFHDDWAKIVTSRVFTRKTAPPTGRHVFQRSGTTFELNQHIIKTNILTNFELDRDFIGTKLLTKFHEDRTINVASRVFTNKYDGQRPVTKAHLSNQLCNRPLIPLPTLATCQDTDQYQMGL
ncbi:hypothetical protein DPMN_125360 [Dreissena polymorpha]|uniref:Uncharacterized protein n=1 Tax=Dreissena polymorpha TaxID=45954 RepID=A0A9D4GV56_DREPO|nr:hypothetical protein DPMN_125360 [Dreissena polymorpha]